MVEARSPRRRLDAYIDNYLKEEIAAEGLVRNLPAFSGFLHAAALCDGEMVNFSNVASDCAVSSHTVARKAQLATRDATPGVYWPSWYPPSNGGRRDWRRERCAMWKRGERSRSP